MDLDTDNADSAGGTGTGTGGNGAADASAGVNGTRHPGGRGYSGSHHSGDLGRRSRVIDDGNTPPDGGGTGINEPGSTGCGTGGDRRSSQGHQDRLRQQQGQPASPLPTLPPSAAAAAAAPPTESGRRRRHRDKERVRVTRACDRCKKRKIRCTGIQPCELCIRAQSCCTYNASYARGRQPPVATREDVIRVDLDGLDVSVPGPGAASAATASAASTATAVDGRLMDFVVDAARRDDEAVDTDDARPGTPEPSPSRESPEPTQTDLQGHFVGPSSGVSFLLRVQKRLHQTVSFSQASSSSSSSSIFTFGDAPLPGFDPSGAFCVLLSREEAQALLTRYFEFAVPTHRFLHRPTVEGWLDEFYRTAGAMESQEDAPARRALLFMVFAQAQEYMAAARSRADGSAASARYFLAADHQLRKEKGAVRLTSVQARLCQCFWLLSQSRINHCWSLFGTAGHLALAIGLNRNRHAVPAGGHSDYVELECRRRTFWCAYSLDNYLSAALGRPRTFHDDDIDQELPSCSEDADIHADHVTPRTGRGQSLMLAPVAHVKLSRIVSMILRDLYSIRPSSFSNRCALAAKYSQSLKLWRAELSQFLDDGVNPALLMPIFQRQRTVLNLAYWHAMMLTHRPFLLGNFARLQRDGGGGGSRSRRRGVPHKDQTEDSVRACLDAAMHVVDTVNDLIQAGQLFRAFWFTSYFAFSAVVILYVHTIQQRAAPAEAWQAYFGAASRCQAQLASLADDESTLAARYCLVLEELRAEALRQTDKRLRHADVSRADAAAAAQKERVQGQVENRRHQQRLTSLDFPGVGRAEDLIGFDESPSSSLADMTSWGQFDSMVASGFGGLETLLNDGSLRF
ncbi:hypothetical protein LX36DRAFT_635949 [Colletotrichum falcatum]|nr:hypothetical protein LX36DRAFT_635949 [Colletotrichum falcatum]